VIHGSCEMIVATTWCRRESASTTGRVGVAVVHAGRWDTEPDPDDDHTGPVHVPVPSPAVSDGYRDDGRTYQLAI
jgi:hypothetical protein